MVSNDDDKIMVDKWFENNSDICDEKNLYVLTVQLHDWNDWVILAGQTPYHPRFYFCCQGATAKCVNS